MKKSERNSNFFVEYRSKATKNPGAFALATNDFYEIYTYIHGEGPLFFFVK